MKISLIFAQNEQGAIGHQGEHPLPWHFPEDLHHFKTLTQGHPLVMGRATFNSLPGLLPNRHHVVLTHDPILLAEPMAPDSQVEYCCNLTAALTVALHRTAMLEVFVIGGAKVLDESIYLADTVYRTRIKGSLLDASVAPLAVPREVCKVLNSRAFFLAESVRCPTDPRLTFETWRRG